MKKSVGFTVPFFLLQELDGIFTRSTEEEEEEENENQTLLSLEKEGTVILEILRHNDLKFC